MKRTRLCACCNKGTRMCAVLYTQLSHGVMARGCTYTLECDFRLEVLAGVASDVWIQTCCETAMCQVWRMAWQCLETCGELPITSAELYVRKLPSFVRGCICRQVSSLRQNPQFCASSAAARKALARQSKRTRTYLSLAQQRSISTSMLCFNFRTRWVKSVADNAARCHRSHVQSPAVCNTSRSKAQPRLCTSPALL